MSFCFLYNIVTENHSAHNSPWVRGGGGGKGLYSQLKLVGWLVVLGLTAL